MELQVKILIELYLDGQPNTDEQAYFQGVKEALDFSGSSVKILHEELAAMQMVYVAARNFCISSGSADEKARYNHLEYALSKMASLYKEQEEPCCNICSGQHKDGECLT